MQPFPFSQPVSSVMTPLLLSSAHLLEKHQSSPNLYSAWLYMMAWKIPSITHGSLLASLGHLSWLMSWQILANELLVGIHKNSIWITYSVFLGTSCFSESFLVGENNTPPSEGRDASHGGLPSLHRGVKSFLHGLPKSKAMFVLRMGCAKVKVHDAQCFS